MHLLKALYSDLEIIINGFIDEAHTRESYINLYVGKYECIQR